MTKRMMTKVPVVMTMMRKIQKMTIMAKADLDNQASLSILLKTPQCLSSMLVQVFPN